MKQSLFLPKSSSTQLLYRRPLLHAWSLTRHGWVYSKTRRSIELDRVAGLTLLDVGLAFEVGTGCPRSQHSASYQVIAVHARSIQASRGSFIIQITLRLLIFV